MADRLEISADKVRALIADQFPQWADLAIRQIVPGGWDNRTFRLGETMSVRLPSARRYAAQVAKEQRILPVLAPQLPFEIPRPIALGRASPRYPFSFGIHGWIEGEPALTAAIGDMAGFADALATFVRSLHLADAGAAPPAGRHNFHRGGDIAVYGGETLAAIAELSGEIDATTAALLWSDALSSRWEHRPVWVHGDLAPGNILIRDGRLAAVIDFGSSACGDPACDLAIAWTFLSGEARTRFRAGLRPDLRLDAQTWQRARGWALWKALITTVQMRREGSPLLGGQRRVLETILREAP